MRAKSASDDASDEFSRARGARRQQPHRQERHSMSRGGVGARRGLLRLALGGHQAAPFDVREVPNALTCRAPNRRLAPQKNGAQEREGVSRV